MSILQALKRNRSKMPPWQIVTATHADLESVLQLQNAWKKEDLAYNYTVDSETFLRSRLSAFFVVAKVQDVLTGFAVAKIQTNTELSIFAAGERYLMIEDVYVTRKFRTHGLGSALVQELVARAEQEGVHRCLVYSSIKELDPILNFYRNNGFKTWNIQFFK